MPKLIVANWKMNGNVDKVAHDLVRYAENDVTNKTNVVLAVPDIYLAQARQLVINHTAKFNLASQNISHFAGSGAYTGEISGAMLKEFAVQYAIIGHSERRDYFNESGSVLQHKIEIAVANQIVPILCIGENKDIRVNGGYADFLVQQLELLLQVKTALKEIVIAYEPIWSIGTGSVPTLNEISEVIKLIHAFVQTYLPHVKIITLYGGSVSGNNAKDILAIDGVDGVLVGGASLKVDEFIQICAAG